MNVPHLHDWNLTPTAAIELQRELVAQVRMEPALDLSTVRHVAGVDVSVKDNVSQAAVVVLSFPDLKVVETVTHQMPTPFPYIPGLLSFREGPVLEFAFGKLQTEPDAFIFDGMGRAHPRRFGIACHLGLWIGKPSLGCGKTHFVGTFDDPANKRGAYSQLYDRGEVIGAVVRTRDTAKPVYISIGHLITLESAIELTMRCTGKYRLPEPIRAAHHAAGQYGEGGEG